mgnify:CR=1 FL=1
MFLGKNRSEPQKVGKSLSGQRRRKREGSPRPGVASHPRPPRFFPWRRRRPGRGTGTSRERTPGTGNHPGRRPPGQPSVYPCRLPVGPGALNRRPTRGSRTRAPPPRPALCWGSAPPPPPAPFPPPTGVLASSPKGSLPDLGVGIFHTRRSARIFLR